MLLLSEEKGKEKKRGKSCLKAVREKAGQESVVRIKRHNRKAFN